MGKRSKSAKPLQLVLPGLESLQVNPGLLAGCIDLNIRAHQREYNSWAAMIYRCEKPEYQPFNKYGGKGVKVCAEWRKSFAAFVRDMGPRPDGMTLDRIKSNGDYEPSNCRWLDASENSRRAAVRSVGVFRSRCVAAHSVGLLTSGVSTRLRDGWCEEHATTVPKGSKRPADCPVCERNNNEGRRFVRLRRGWCEEHAATLPKGSKRPADCEECSKRKEKSK